MREVYSLNTEWKYRIGSGRQTTVKVPYSALPAGRSVCSLCIDPFLNGSGKRVFVVFEGITYHANVYMNGELLGDMYPYSEYRFEITDRLKKCGNELSVEIFDIGVKFGPSEGWENYSGIIRPVFLEYTDDFFLENIEFVGELNSDYSAAHCTVNADVEGCGNYTFEAVLYDGEGNAVGRGSTENTTGAVFEIASPSLWSPDSPVLYKLCCSLTVNGKCIDKLECRVGFKDLAIRGKRFYLNGEALFILGVNRHDMFGDNGHTLTYDEMYRDMKMIKETGANFVRLVHYPHNKKILDIADEIGLMVSEEPGLWWSDMTDKDICDGALEVLRRVVIRDRSHISIAFWLSFNECKFTPEFLMDSVNVCRKYDAHHMVSGANCMSVEMTKEHFARCGFDFYTMHPYYETPELILKFSQELTDMPLLFTEWGGYPVYNNESILKRFIQTICELWKNSEDKPVAAGAIYWCWAEMYEFSRGEPACSDGILHEGLVDIYRNKTPNYDIFVSEFAKLEQENREQEYMLDKAPVRFEKGNYTAIELCDGQDFWDEMTEKSKERVEPFFYDFKAIRKMTNGPVLPCPCGLDIPTSLRLKPVVIGDEYSVCIDAAVSEIFIFGNVSMPKGYPISGEYGESVAEYILVYGDGSEEAHTMKNGIDFTTATAQHGPSRINPVCGNAARIFRYSYDFDWEHYICNLCVLKADVNKKLTCIKFRNCKNGYYPLLYGITVKA